MKYFVVLPSLNITCMKKIFFLFLGIILVACNSGNHSISKERQDDLIGALILEQHLQALHTLGLIDADSLQMSKITDEIFNKLEEGDTVSVNKMLKKYNKIKLTKEQALQAYDLIDKKLESVKETTPIPQGEGAGVFSKQAYLSTFFTENIDFVELYKAVIAVKLIDRYKEWMTEIFMLIDVFKDGILLMDKSDREVIEKFEDDLLKKSDNALYLLIWANRSDNRYVETYLKMRGRENYAHWYMEALSFLEEKYCNK